MSSGQITWFRRLATSATAGSCGLCCKFLKVGVDSWVWMGLLVIHVAVGVVNVVHGITVVGVVCVVITVAILAGAARPATAVTAGIS